jgi:hypothetical protein
MQSCSLSGLALLRVMEVEPASFHAVPLAGSLGQMLMPECCLDAIFKASPDKNTVLVKALKASGLYSTIGGPGWRGTLLAPTDDVRGPRPPAAACAAACAAA